MYQTIILSFVLYGIDTGSFHLKENHRLSMKPCSLIGVPKFRMLMEPLCSSSTLNMEATYFLKMLVRPSLWSSCQNSWLQFRRPVFDSRHYQKKKCSGSGTGCTQPREYKLRSYLIEK
jgi:hypothetical protein